MNFFQKQWQKLQNWLGNDLQRFHDTREGALNRLDKLFLLAIVVVGAALYLPALNFLLMDPWENHYSQVTWETLQHGAFAQLWYQGSNHFWSKPPLLFWLQMPFFMFGINEFLARIPVVLFSLGTLCGFYLLLTRLFSRSSALASAFVLMMAPHYFQLSRQVMVDLPFIGLNTLAILSMAVYFFGPFDEEEKIRIGFKKFGITMSRKNFYLYLFYFLEGWAFLAKGLLSIIIPGTAFFIYILISGNFGAFLAWRNLKKHLLGFGLYLLVASPWLIYLSIIFGKDFLNEFIVYHHFKRVAGEIHKPNDLFTLYIRVLGYSTFPWVAFIPAAFYRFFNDGGKSFLAHKKRLFIFAAFVGPFFFLAYSSTKFHHYIAPTVPFLALIVGLYLDGLFRTKWTVTRKMELLVALFILGAVARDLGNKFMVWVYMVTFFQERQGPKIPELIPFIAVAFSIFGLTLIISMYSEWFKKRLAVVLLFAATASFMLFFFIEAMPRVATWYSYKPLWDAYLKDSPERAPVAQYYKWLEKSLSFWSYNEITFVASDKEDTVLRFYDRPGKQYAIVKNPDKTRFENLMRRINKKPEIIAKIPQNVLYRVSGGNAKDLSNKGKWILPAVPADAIPVGAIFDNVIEMVGYKILQGSTTVPENSVVKIEVYFKALKGDMPRDYTVFVHNEGNQKDMRTKDDQPMAMGEYPTTFWKQGDIVRHVISVHIPGGSKNSYYTVYTGIYQEDYRAYIKNPESVKNDGDNRLALVNINIQR